MQLSLRVLLFPLFVVGLVMAISSQSIAATPGVSAKAADVCPLKVGQSVPDVSLLDMHGKEVKLQKLVSEKPSVLIFYRGGWCPYCNVHLGELQTIESELKGLGYQIIGISPDNVKSLNESIEKNGVNYQLLSDSSAEVIKAFGLAFENKKRGVLPIPAAYLVDSKGKITFAFTSADYKVRIDKNVMLAAAKSAAKKSK